MGIQVHDYRTDLQNIEVHPQIRSRFRRVELGARPPVHSHDLGGETFLVMEGQIEFTVADESVVCTQGQAIYVPPRTTHAVRAVGDKPGAIYLSVTPHVEPTHTQYDAAGSCLPPRYGVWRAAGGGEGDSELPTRALLEQYREAASALLGLLGWHEAAIPEDVNGDDVKSSIDQMWESLRPVLQQLEEVERSWNALALRGSDGSGGG